MNHTLKNDFLHIAISELGAELQSIACAKTGENFLWNGDASVWSGRAPVLFPIVGALKNGQMLHNGKPYNLPRHGLARTAHFEPTGSSDESVSFTLQSNEQTLAIYPWHFTLQIIYTLHNNQLAIEYRVTTQSEAMLFSIGAHPAFCLADTLEDYQLQFSATESLQRFALNSAGLLAANSEPFALTDNSIALSSTLFDDDALVFKSVESPYISLQHKQTERLRVYTGGAPHLGLWSKPGAAFVCIEPWFGYSDDINASGIWQEKPALQSVSSKDSFSHKWAIEITSVSR